MPLLVVLYFHLISYLLIDRISNWFCISALHVVTLLVSLIKSNSPFKDFHMQEYLHSLSCCIKILQTGELKNNMNIFLCSGGWKIQDQGTNIFSPSKTHPLIVSSQSILLAIPLLMATSAVSISQLLWIMVPSNWKHRYHLTYWFSSSAYISKVEWLDHW